MNKENTSSNEFILSLIQEVNRLLLNYLSPDYEHINELEMDLNPRHEAFWFVDGIMPPERVTKLREKMWQKNMANDPILRPYQYLGQPILTLRHKNPLDPIIQTVSKTRDDVPVYKYDCRTLGYTTEYRHGVTIPGFWPGASNEHAILSYQRRSFIPLNTISALQKSDQQNMIHSLGIQSSFAWLHGIASYHGFSTFNDITYPLTTQTIVTDGKTWSFYAYQLNTTRIGNKTIPGNPNLCWGTKETNLFESINENGVIEGLNVDVLKNLIKFYINIPKQRDINMKPYLGDIEKTASDIQHEERRIFLEKTFKHLFSNRPRHRLPYEIYNWEKIYKIDHQTRPMDPKRRPFELGQFPYKRRLDDHSPKYIPKALRPGGPKSPIKWEKTYYP